MRNLQRKLVNKIQILPDTINSNQQHPSLTRLISQGKDRKIKYLEWARWTIQRECHADGGNSKATSLPTASLPDTNNAHFTDILVFCLNIKRKTRGLFIFTLLVAVKWTHSLSLLLLLLWVVVCVSRHAGVVRWDISMTSFPKIRKNSFQRLCKAGQGGIFKFYHRVAHFQTCVVLLVVATDHPLLKWPTLG